MGHSSSRLINLGQLFLHLLERKENSGTLSRALSVSGGLLKNRQQNKYRVQKLKIYVVELEHSDKVHWDLLYEGFFGRSFWSVLQSFASGPE